MRRQLQHQRRAGRAFTNVFTVVPAAGINPGRLWCSVNNAGSVAAPGVALAEGIQDMAIYYGVKRNVPLTRRLQR